MMMEATPTAPLEMVQSEFLLEFLIVAFDAPTQFRYPDQFAHRCIGRERTQEVLERLGVAFGHSMSSHSCGRSSLRQ